MAKLKAKFKGNKTFSRLLNKMVEVNEENAYIFLLEGRNDLFEPLLRKPLKKKTVKKEVKKEEKKDENS